MRFVCILLIIGFVFSCTEEKKETTGFTPVKEESNADSIFAPFPPVPDSIPGKATYERMRRDFIIPTLKEVGIPSYPNSYAVSGQKLMDLNTEVILPSIIIATEDDKEKVIEFYANALGNWKFDDVLSIFWKGEEEHFPTDNRNKIESVLIKSASQPLTKILVPEAKTEVIITYQPK